MAFGDLDVMGNSQAVIQYLQKRYGSADYKNWQALRGMFYSFVKYPEAGQSVFNFFGDSIGTANNLQLTNMPKQNSFGQVHFQVKALRTSWFINNQLVTEAQWDGTDASTLYSDFVNGLFQAGVLEWVIGGRSWLQLPKPFLYAPPADGRGQLHSAGLDGITLNEATPNTFASLIGPEPFADLMVRRENAFVLDPSVLIEAEQNFGLTISFPSGIVPVVGTGVTDDTTNPLYIGVILDGIVFRPLQ